MITARSQSLTLDFNRSPPRHSHRHLPLPGVLRASTSPKQAVTDQSSLFLKSGGWIKTQYAEQPECVEPLAMPLSLKAEQLEDSVSKQTPVTIVHRRVRRWQESSWVCIWGRSSAVSLHPDRALIMLAAVCSAPEQIKWNHLNAWSWKQTSACFMKTQPLTFYRYMRSFWTTNFSDRLVDVPHLCHPPFYCDLVLDPIPNSGGMPMPVYFYFDWLVIIFHYIKM